MKQIIQEEKYITINDFTGHQMVSNLVPVTMIMEFGYGSTRDGERIELHFDDEHVEMFLNLIRRHRKVGKIVE